MNPTLLGAIKLCFRNSVHVPEVRTTVMDVCGEVFKHIVPSVCARRITNVTHRSSAWLINMRLTSSCNESSLLPASMGVRSLNPINEVPVRRCLRTLILLLNEGHFTATPTRKWLSRVLGNPQAFLRLIGPRAVRTAQSLFTRRAALLTSIRCLLTILNKVVRAPVGVWPTLLISMRLVNIGFRRKLKLPAPTPKIAAFNMLSGTKLGANRTWSKLVPTKCVIRWVSSAPVIFGIFLSNIRLPVRIIASIRLIARLRFITIAVTWLPNVRTPLEKRAKLICPLAPLLTNTPPTHDRPPYLPH